MAYRTWGPVSVCLLAAAFMLTSGSRAQTPPLRPSLKEVRPTYKTPEELGAAAKEMLTEDEPNPPSAAGPPPRDDGPWLFVLDYLDSPDPKMRDEAVGLVMRGHILFRVNAIKKYLADTYPVNVRMAALAHALGMRLTTEEAGRDTPGARQRQWRELRGVFSRLVNEIVAGPVTPPYFTEVMSEGVIVSAQPENVAGEHIVIDPSKRALMLRRCLRVLAGSKEVKNQSPGNLFWFIASHPSDLLAKELVLWYETESDVLARRLIVNEMVQIMYTQGQNKLLRPLFELAAKDPDTQNAARAKEELKQIDAGK